LLKQTQVVITAAVAVSVEDSLRPLPRPLMLGREVVLHLSMECLADISVPAE
jgi:hypothetical protein